MGSPVVAVDEAVPHFPKPLPRPAVLTFSPGNQRRKVTVNKSVLSSASICKGEDLQPVPTPAAFQESSTLGERLRIAKEMCVLSNFVQDYTIYFVHFLANLLVISELTPAISQSF